ncbi:4-hydroxybenzoate polyprenyl transferase, partial [Lentinula detonsa]
IEISRVQRFAGTMILFWPFAWSLTMTSRQLGVPAFFLGKKILGGFIGAAFLHRTSFQASLGGGCIWNDIVDMDLDAQRTKHRPLPDGKISVFLATIFLLIHVLILGILSISMNSTSYVLAFLTAIPLTGIYPYMKRVTDFPQVWLGFTLNVPVLIGSSIVTNNISGTSLILAFGSFAWTMWYDTIYGSQDKRDDMKAGVKSIVLILHHYQYTHKALGAFASALLLSWIVLGVINDSSIWYFVITIGGGGLLLIHDYALIDLDRPESCLYVFERSGFVIGPLVWFGFMIDYMLGNTGLALS